MSGQRYTPKFKDEAIKQVIDRGYSIAKTSERLGVSQHSLYKWVNAAKPAPSEQQANEYWNRSVRFLNYAPNCVILKKSAIF